ncbi:molecular chaperone HscC [Candidatus Enterococcus mansonii]|uniref:Chaperone protein DnaK n=1 Tax=Candidatus Enterococcus mansonii TaxID=1834181 RepID=A0A242CH02_9ENTE|nr:molecular chaperone HscC [Enterococcus sp. 4G2_DIV0659]OTO09523.1 hypothetical protein A5880_000202 [Enterococcus sp. 4G2_DIV0659]
MILGIDLGTSNSLVSFWDGENIQIIPNRFGDNLTPSVVGIDDNGDILVGSIAKERLVSHSELTVATFKRFMGTEKRYQLGSYEFTPVELSSLVLRSLKEDAETFLQKECKEVVISVPAYFNNLQREATVKAAELSGFVVKNLISEPTAAAMAYGFHKKEDQSVLVVDLGGGTFDVSLLEMFDGIIQVEAISGDSDLGGEDFTKLILNDFFKKNELKFNDLTAEDHSMIYKKAESLKKLLTLNTTASFKIELDNKSFTYELAQEEYKELCQVLLKKMRAPISRVLNDARMSINEINQVILIGGATKNPIVRNYLSKLFQKLPFSQIDPDETVGVGAGIQGALKKDRTMVNELMLTDVCAHTLGVNAVSHTSNGYIDGVFVPIIERNTTIPVSKRKTFYTLRDNQKQVEFSIYQGEYPMVKENLKIGEITIKIPPSKENTPIDCRFSYDSNGLLEVNVTDNNGKSSQLIIDSSSGKLTDEQINESLNKMRRLKIHPRDRSENRLLMAKLERLFVEMTGIEREQIQKLIVEFTQVLEEQDEILTKRYTANLKKTIDYFEGDEWL